MDPAGTERRLAAIISTDIVGYTALMGESEEKGCGSGTGRASWVARPGVLREECIDR